MARYIFITGGVVSSLGKGIASAALAALLKARGYKVRNKKLDPYLNVDPGTMSPYQHGECYVTDDGAETDLDLGHYERFTGVSSKKSDNITTGQIYWSVLTKERRGDYLGGTVQVIPHVTNEIKDFIAAGVDDEDFVLCELGGTVGDIEGLPYLESIRQFANEKGRENVMFMHLTLLPYIPTAGELKTKPTQQSVHNLLSYGIQPDMLLCRADRYMGEDERRKIALFCNVKPERVISAVDVDNIYKIPCVYHGQGMDQQVCEYFKLPINQEPNLCSWEGFEKKLDFAKNNGKVRVAIAGKYVVLPDAYKSLSEALFHAGVENGTKVEIDWVNTEEINTMEEAKKAFENADGILVPGGFGSRGTDGKMLAVQYARENNIPFFGICFGMQMAVLETMRNLVGVRDAVSSELSKEGTPVVSLITEWEKDGRIETRTKNSDMGGTMRLGGYPCHLEDGSKTKEIYGESDICERHRHRYEVNNKYENALKENGMIVVGKSPDGLLPEIVERPDHKWFIGVQFHPELRSRPFEPHPLFVSFVDAMKK